MEKLTEYTDRLSQVLQKGVDGSGRVDISRLTRKDKLSAIGILCEAIDHIIQTNLHITIFEQISELTQEIDKPQTADDAKKVVEFFEVFLMYEERLFEMRGMPRWVARETFEASGDIQGAIALCLTDPEYRKQWLTTDGLTEKLSMIRETLCTAQVADLDRQLENRHILGGLTAAAINTGFDLALGTIVVFNIISALGGAIIAYKRINW